MLANKHVITNQIPMIKDQIDKMRLNRCNLHAAIQNLNFVSVDQAHIPLGGRLEFFIKNWEKVSSDQKILNQVKGFKLDFVQEQFQNFEPKEIKLSQKETDTLDVEIKAMIEQKAVEIVSSSLDPENQFFSHHFVRPQKDGGSRPIFNLKQLNQWVKYEHFKFEGFVMVKSVMKMGDFLCKIDLKDAYQCIQVHPLHRKFLRFMWKGKILQYRSLPSGLTSGPRLIIYKNLETYGGHTPSSGSETSDLFRRHVNSQSNKRV